MRDTESGRASLKSIYLAGKRAGQLEGLEQAAKVCDDFPNWSEECEEWSGKFAAAIRALAEYKAG